MSNVETANLIDLSIEDEDPAPLPNTFSKTALNDIPSMISQRPPVNLQGNIKLSSFIPSHRRESLDNNPFDSVQKLVNRLDDPFEIVEREICKQAQSIQPAVEVKLGNLLSLSDDNLLNDDDDEDISTNPEQSKTCAFDNDSGIQNADLEPCNQRSNVAVDTGPSSTHPNTIMFNGLDSESPPISMSQKWTPDSGNSADSADSGSSAEVGASGGKTRKAVEYRKQLLRLSLSNSTFNSPVSRRLPQSSECFSDSSAFSMILSEAAQTGEHLLAAESPLKLVDDDLMSEEPNWVDSEKEFEADLEMLKIPMLEELPPSPAVEVQPPTLSPKTEKKDIINLSDLAAIRAKLKAKREETNNKDISDLINNLKTLISDINVGDSNKKQEASKLLDTLSSALSSNKCDDKPLKDEKPSTTMSTLTPPQPIVRQGTFDIELQEKEKQKSANEPVQSDALVTEMPDVMFKSSATYDGENTDEKQDIALPEVEPLSPQPMQHPDVNDIVEQLGKLLEQHQLNSMHSEPGSDGTQQAQAPTFIVVMNTSQVQVPSAKQRSSYIANYLENSINDGSPDLSNSSNVMRRRSQSLSIHDKLKVVKLPMVPPSAVVPAVGNESIGQQEAVKTPPLDTEAPEFKTPSRMMPRRNSFSSGTPYTPMHSGLGAVGQKRMSGISDTLSQSRRSAILATHHEGQHNTSTTAAIVRPMPQLNMHAKSELSTKKKLKSSYSADSILKSSGPMKATIPVKKVAPMIKTSPPTSDALTDKVQSSMNTSMHMLSKSGRMSYTSTPMPQARSLSASGFPSACSTPSVRTSPSPMKRITGTTTKSRYSYLSVTPNGKHPTSSAAASGMKRRTLSEFKAKSPIKPRLSGIGSMAPSSVSERTTTTRNAMKQAPSTTRIGTKSVPTANGRPSTRLSSRTSYGGITQRNKENKYP